LDMAPNSFDDQYLKCPGMWMRLPMLNRFEFALNSLYARVWAMADAKKEPEPLGSLQRREEAVALRAYTMADTGLYREFNDAVRKGGRSLENYLEKFDYKVMHFLLTEALGDLRKNKSHLKCLDVYRGTRDRFTAKPGEIIRFGQFTSTSLRKSVSEGFGTATIFEVHTCHGAKIEDFSAKPEEKEVLIPPFETFKVINVSHQSHTTFIQLRSHSVHSNYNCALLKGDIPG
ncbi:NARE ribosyltransferase, partial [Sakesphorus luctuosus]|nr:NARE ribosyltransferase [Sakesphorus luctuosus]